MNSFPINSKKTDSYIFAAINIALMVLFLSIKTKAYGGDLGFQMAAEDIIASVHTNNLDSLDQTLGSYLLERHRLIGRLSTVLENTNFVASNLNQCAAAYYLGAMHASETVDILSSKITLGFDMSRFGIHRIPGVAGYPAMDALVKIGSASIPALLRNLATSDDAKVRSLSLTVLCRIDGDKDISQLRLQKALKAENDTQRRTRLQAAFKMLTVF